MILLGISLVVIALIWFLTRNMGQEVLFYLPRPKKGIVKQTLVNQEGGEIKDLKMWGNQLTASSPRPADAAELQDLTEPAGSAQPALADELEEASKDSIR